MSDTDFLKQLSSSNAEPDAAFIDSLRDKVVAAAPQLPLAPEKAAGASSSAPISKLALIALAVLATGAVLLIVLFARANNQEQTDVQTPEPTTQEEVTSEPDVAGTQDDTDTDEGTDVEDNQVVDPVASDTAPPSADTATSTDPVDDPADEPSSDTPVDDPSDDSTVDEDTSFSVSYWTFDEAEGPPKFPGTPAEYSESASEIDFDWKLGSPGGDIGPDYFLVRATKQTSLKAGSYTLDWLTDDGMRVYIGSNKILDNWTSKGAGTLTFTLTKDLPNTVIIVESYELTRSARLRAIISPAESSSSVDTVPSLSSGVRTHSVRSR